MNNIIIKNEWCSRSTWESKKDNLKTRFPLLSDADLVYESDRFENRIEELGKLLGLTRDELHIVILTL
jgi:hypothetical protein